MSTVFVVNMIKDDISRAAAYGELKHINLRYVYPDELEPSAAGDVIPVEFQRELRRQLGGFDPARDYLLIAGDHLQLVQAAALLGKLYGRFRVLRWDRQAKGYVPVTIVA